MATVTINNHEQRQVDQRILVNQLVDNGLLGVGKRLIGGAKTFGKGIRRGISSPGIKLKGANKPFASGYKAGAGIGSAAGKAKGFAKSPAGKMTGMGAGLAGTAGAGVAVGRASGGRRRRK